MLWLNGFTSFSVKPLRIASFFGGFFAFLGFLLTIIMVIRQFICPEPIIGWTSLMCALLIVSGLNMLMLVDWGNISEGFLSVRINRLSLLYGQLYRQEKPEKDED